MRAFLGILLILHGLAHAGAGMWSSGPEWVVAALWALTTVAFILGGLRVLGLPIVPLRAPTLVMLGAVTSVPLLITYQHQLMLPGIALDVLCFGLALRRADNYIGHPLAFAGSWRRRTGAVVATIVLAYVAGVIMARPWYMRWGTSRADRTATLFGDSLDPAARYIVNNAVTIHAPADSVWPWLEQLGQDRGGFYSYRRLENFFGARMTNADSIVPEWQGRVVGDFVRAVPADWLGGRFGPNLGWNISALEPGRAMVLDKWGAFVVVPVDSHTTRLHVRQRNPGRPSLLGTVMAPAGLLVFEPAHFIMQRGMLLGIKRRAERGRA